VTEIQRQSAARSRAISLAMGIIQHKHTTQVLLVFRLSLIGCE